jgi:hypothetical protein
MSDGLFAAFIAAHQEVRDLPDDFGIPLRKAAAFLHRTKGQLDKLRVAGTGPRFYKDASGHVFYPLGELRKFHSATPLHESTQEYGGAYGFLAGQPLSKATIIPFWVENSTRRIIGPVYGPCSGDFRVGLTDAAVDVEWLTPPESLLLPWRDEAVHLDARKLWEKASGDFRAIGELREALALRGRNPGVEPF